MRLSASNEAGYITGYTWLRVKSKFPRFLPQFKKRVEKAQWQRLEERLEPYIIYIQHIQLLECMVGACARLVSDSVI